LTHSGFNPTSHSFIHQVFKNKKLYFKKTFRKKSYEYLKPLNITVSIILRIIRGVRTGRLRLGFVE